ncbi:hypothetical protein AAG906_012853 [Vitis piasezkii]
MAKFGVLETDPSMAAKATEELKKELQRLVSRIVDEDESCADTTDKALKILFALRDFKFKGSLDFGVEMENPALPQEFRCPISKQLMRDPVVVATGQTYDRPFIQKWLKDGHRTCPRTQQVLSHTILTPNNLVREMISEWCKEHGIELPKPVEDVDEEVITDADRGHLNSLLERMSSSASDQKEAARELRLLTKRMPSFRALFGECTDAVPQLLSLLSPDAVDVDPELQEDLITTVLNLSIHDNNKKLVAEDPMAIPVLIESLKSGTIETRTNAAAALFTLSALDSNKLIIGKSGALKPLLDLLEEGHPLAMKDVASAIFNLCIKIMDGILVDELLAILAMLSSHQRAVEEMGELGAVPCLLRIIRESKCERNKENCIAILHTVCFNDRAKLRAIREEENDYGTISRLAQTGTSRAKRKANGILERLNRVALITHTA